MKGFFLTFAFFAALSAGSLVALADSTGKPPAINESGTYHDGGVWIYRTPDGRYKPGSPVSGTNETLIMPPPSPEAGGAVDAVELVRHPFDTLGYPMHIGLVEKLFASSYQVSIFTTDRTVLWQYKYGDPVENETRVTGKGRPAFKAWGPFHADSVPLADISEPLVADAFDFAKKLLNSIINLPEEQKNLANYGVLFIDDGSTVWAEFGPRFAVGESPHLGCQTELGRDMVFGYDKKQQSQGQSGKFLQCF